MITVKQLLESRTGCSPDGKHWEPALPEGRWGWWRVRLQDAIAVWRGDAVAIRQTTKDDLAKATKEQP